MIEVGEKAAKNAHEKLAMSSTPITVVHHDEAGMFERFIVMSGYKFYEVLRLEYFASCQCPNFTQGHAACKHIAITLPLVCVMCFERPVAIRGDKCRDCFYKTEGFLRR